MPTIISNADSNQFLLSMCSEIGGGIIAGWYFIYLLEKSNTLWVPILVHAILDYSVGPIGIIAAIVIFVHLLLKSKQQRFNKY